MILRIRCSFALLAFPIMAWVAGSPRALAGLTDRVVVVRNGNSPVSCAVADDYARRRSVTNVLTLTCQDAAANAEAETIDFMAYQREIEGPLKGFLASHAGVDFIVLTKGIPIRLIHVGDATLVDRFSLDSRLAALDYEKIPNAVRVDISDRNYDTGWRAQYGKDFHALAWANRFWNSTEPFAHVRFGGYLVTRLDGYSEADAMALTTRSLEAEQALRAGKMPEGEVLLDVSLNYGFTDRARQPYDILKAYRAGAPRARITSESNFGEFNSDMQLAADILMARGVPVELSATGRFTGNRAGLMGYVSWGSNDGKFDAAAYHSLTFAPGAISETAVSTSGRTFLPTHGGQSLSADLIAQGASGAKGYTDEPLLQAIASPSILLERYTRGWTLAESFYAASALVGWEDIVIGDPLCRAYPVVEK
jgi:uncharacterized protein (TIGR03790 family)